MTDFQTHYEEFKVHGKDLVDKVKSLIHEGNIRRIIVKDQNGVTFLEIPLTVAAVGVLAVPVLAALGALAVADAESLAALKGMEMEILEDGQIGVELQHAQRIPTVDPGATARRIERSICYSDGVSTH